MIFLENLIAQRYGMSPSQFRALSWEDRAEMTAFIRDSELMASYENVLASKRMNKQGKK